MRPTFFGKLLIILAVLLVIQGGLFVLIQQQVILPSFTELEEQQVTADVNRVSHAITRELHHLERIVYDWSAWDDIYQYVLDRDPAFIEHNLNDTAYAINDLNLALILDPSGRTLWGKALDHDRGEPLGIDTFAGDRPLTGSPLLALPKPGQPMDSQWAGGLVMTNAGPMLCAARQILDSNTQGPARGFLVMGRLLSNDHIARLAEQTETDLGIFPLRGRVATTELLKHKTLPLPGEVATRSTADQTEGFTSYPDILGQPALLIKVVIPREVLAHGQQTMQLALVFFSVGLLLTFIAAVLVLRGTVVVPLRTLTHRVLGIRQDGLTADALETVGGTCEIALLAGEFRQLIEELDRKGQELARLNLDLRDETEKLRQAEHHLKQLDDLKNEFISTAAHELRTPMSSVMGYTDLLANETEFGPFTAAQREDFLREIQENSEGLTRIIDNILDVSRIESGQAIPLHREPCDLAALLERVVNRFRLQARNHALTLTLAPDFPATVSLDVQRVTQVLENLLSNAIKYSPHGGPIELSAGATADQCQVIIADQGIGMTPQQLSRIFDKFYRADGSNTAVRGLGLGMSIVRQIISDHGGEIRVESRFGEGTQIHLTLPVG